MLTSVVTPPPTNCLFLDMSPLLKTPSPTHLTYLCLPLLALIRPFLFRFPLLPCLYSLFNSSCHLLNSTFHPSPSLLPVRLLPQSCLHHRPPIPLLCSCCRLVRVCSSPLLPMLIRTSLQYQASYPQPLTPPMAAVLLLGIILLHPLLLMHLSLLILLFHHPITIIQ